MNAFPTQAKNVSRKPMLGCVADDVTGATDLATNLVQGGMCVVLSLGVPSLAKLKQLDADVIVVALKTRSIAREEAVARSLAAVVRLQELGIERFFFKYCSTFDSTEHGNIGPVAEAMLEALNEVQAIICPAFPRNGRTVYQGHLFVKDRLLSESGMEDHPLNPMTDSNLLRLLGKQTENTLGLLPYDKISEDPQDIVAELRKLVSADVKLVITDSCDERHLSMLAHAVASMRLVTGSSGIARFLPEAYRELGLYDSAAYEPELPKLAGRSLILSGSCSRTTNRQVAYMRETCLIRQLDVPEIISSPNSSLEKTIAWAKQTNSDQPLLIASTAPPDVVDKLLDRIGRNEVSTAIEGFHASVADAFVSKLGVRRLVIAGGETAGAVVEKLGIDTLKIGPEICTGVPWTESQGDRPLALALKSGNFGEDNFFETALNMLS